MNKIERVNAVFKGEMPDRVPVCLINFMAIAGEAGIHLGEFFRDGRTMAELHLAALQKYDHDMVHLQNGVVSVAEALGCKVSTHKTVPPTIDEYTISEPAQWRELNKPDFYKPGSLTAELIKTTGILAERIGGEVFIRSEAELGPFTLAGYLLGIENFLLQLSDPGQVEEIHLLLNFLTAVIFEFCAAQAEAGADLIGIGDPLAGPDVCSPEIYRRFSYPYQSKLVEMLKGEDINLVIHMCGNITRIFKDVVKTGALAYEIDYKTDINKIREMAPDINLIGNIDPSNVLARGTTEEVVARTRQVIRVLGREGHFILGPGCDLPYHTPGENIHALVRAARIYGQYN